VSHAACLSTRESLQRSLHLMAKQGGIAAAAVGAAADWRLVLSSAAAVVCLAMWMRSRNE
jgi:tetrahydromethanopterin S-methyltransferase subunit C